MTRLAIIFDNLGPYHVARLQMASTVCDLLAIEVAGKSDVYAWENEAGAGFFKRATLIENATNGGVDKPELCRRLARALDYFKPSVVAIPGWASVAAWAAMIWCAQKRIPMIGMSDSTEWDEPRVGWKEWIKRKLVSTYSTGFVAGRVHQDYLMKLGMPAERIFLGYDVVDNDYFADKAAEIRKCAEQNRNKYGLPANYFLATARFVGTKNLPRLIEAFARYREMAKGGEAWNLVLLGDGELRPELTQLIAGLELEDAVSMPGFVQYPDLPAYYGLANAFVQASSKEPWGLVVNEAMASSLPVLVSNRCGCASELVQKGVNGFTFDPFQVEQLAEKMMQLSSFEPRARKKMGNASRSIISSWGTDRFAAGLKSAAAKAVESNPPCASWEARGLLRALMLR